MAADAMRAKIDLQFILTLEGAMAIGSGFRRGQIQRTVLRDLADLPFIPASTLKGRVRDAAERLARSQGQEICGGPNPNLMCGAKNLLEELCLICRTFGSPGVSSLSGHTGLVWRDANLLTNAELPGSVDEAPDTAAYYYARTQVQLSRLRGTAMEKHLFTSENTLENLVFGGRIRGWLPQREAGAGRFPGELVLLCSALKLLRFVGGGKSRGLGACEVDFPEPLLLDDQPVRVEEVLQEVALLKPRQEA